MSRVFISHASSDSVAARALKTWLEQAEPGLVDEIFLDLDRDAGIPAGVRWKEALRKANERCEAVICLISPRWDGSHECMTEYRIAEDRGKPIFPVRLEPSTGSDITGEWQRCDLFGGGPKTAVAVEGQADPVQFRTEGLLRLQRGLRAAGVAPDSFGWPPDDDTKRAPYRGWRPLEAVDAAVYFGRDAQINRALTAVRELRSSGAEKLFVILGPSGVGKSSFLRAGLLPRLSRDDRHFLPMEIVRPGRDPLTGPQGLASSVHALRSKVGLAQPTLGAIRVGVGDPEQLRRWLIEAQQAAIECFVDTPVVSSPTLVLSIDQAEELFGADAGKEADAFLAVAAGLLQDGEPPLPIVAIATVRADRYEPLQTAPQLAGLGARIFDDLKPLPADRFREVICGPAIRAQHVGSRLQWAPELVERLLQDCAAGADTLPLLSLTLARLYEDYGDGVVGVAEYEAMGGMGRVVENEIESLLAAEPVERGVQLGRLRQAFIPWLATVDPASGEPLRRVAGWFELPGDSHPLIDALVSRRLLIRDQRGGEVVVEVALESLLRQWDTLAGWLREDAADLKETAIVEQAARAWEVNGRQDDWLLPGARLAEAETLAAKPGFRDRLNAAREYLLASRQQVERRAEAGLRAAQERQEAAEALAHSEQRAKVEAEQHAQVLTKRTRVLRAALAAVVAVALAAVVGFGWAWKAQRTADARAHDAAAESMYANSQLILNGLYPGENRDVLGMQLLLAGRAIGSQHQYAEYPLLSALHQERNLLKVIDTDAVVARVAFSPDGRRLVSAGFDGAVRQWDSASGQPIGAPMHHDKQVGSVAYSPDGARIASGSFDSTVRLWDSATGAPIGQPMHHDHGIVTGVAFSPDGTRIASSSGDETVRQWDAATGAPIGQPMHHDGIVWAVAYSPDGTRIASGSDDKTVRLWDPATGKPVGDPLTGHTGPVTSVAFSPDGTRIASGSFDQTVRLWDTATGAPIGQPMHQDETVAGVAFSPDGTRLASAGGDKAVRLWDVGSRRQIGVLSGHRAAVVSVAFSPDGLRIASGAEDQSIRLWDARWLPLVGHDDIVWSAKFLDGGRVIVSGSGRTDTTVRRWDAATGRPIGDPLRVADDDVASLVPLADGRLVSFGSVNTVRLWDASTLVPLGPPLRLPVDPDHTVVYDDKSGRIAAQTGRNVFQLFRADTMAPVGEPIRLDAGTGVTIINFSNDGRIIAAGNTDGTVRLWDSDTGRSLGQPMKSADAFIQTIAFSPDGHMLAVGGFDRTLRLWDTHTFQAIGDTMHLDSIAGVAEFSPDGRTLASGSLDGAIRLWDVSSQAQLGSPYTGHTAGVTSLDFSPDGTQLLSASVDHTLRLWPVPTASPDALCAKLTENMSDSQWKAWVPHDIDYITLCPGLPKAGGG